MAAPCLDIARDPTTAYDYTAKGNLVAVISNGTAILGLDDLGGLASKPVMEGKAALFKRFADVDAIDLELNTRDVDEFVNSVRSLEPSFGGINLEVIKAPECFIIESRLQVIHERVRAEPKRVICAEGEEELTIRAALSYRNIGYDTPVLIGRKNRSEMPSSGSV